MKRNLFFSLLMSVIGENAVTLHFVNSVPVSLTERSGGMTRYSQRLTTPKSNTQALRCVVYNYII